MNILSWVTLSLVIVTFLLAVGAFWSIWQTHNIQKKEYRRRLLNDLIEWAITITNWRSRNSRMFKEMALTVDKNEQRRLRYAHMVELREDFVGLRGRNQYALNVSEKFARILQDAVKRLIVVVESYAECLNDLTQVMKDNSRKGLIETQGYDDYAKKADQLASQIDESARKVIEEAVKINVP